MDLEGKVTLLRTGTLYRQGFESHRASLGLGLGRPWKETSRLGEDSTGGGDDYDDDDSGSDDSDDSDDGHLDGLEPLRSVELKTVVVRLQGLRPACDWSISIWPNPRLIRDMLVARTSPGLPVEERRGRRDATPRGDICRTLGSSQVHITLLIAVFHAIESFKIVEPPHLNTDLYIPISQPECSEVLRRREILSRNQYRSKNVRT